MGTSSITRRPIKARDSRLAARIAATLARAGVRPNTISVFSVVFAAGSGICLWAISGQTPGMKVVLFVTAAIGIQCRLLCNLFDGMVAVEGGRKTKSGEVFNELPDRVADAFVLIGCGYAATVRHGLELGYSAAVLAVIVAYVRTLGAAIGAGQNFCGPMAKQHRMATVTVACLVAAAVAAFGQSGAVTPARVIEVALAAIVVGEIITIGRRTVWVIRTLEAK
jgi:phosphatidylglycerophosphate synthase